LLKSSDEIFEFREFEGRASAPPHLELRSADHHRDIKFDIMGIEEQKEEREVLDSIFPDEITGEGLLILLLRVSLTDWLDISETEYRISVLLDVTNEDGDDSEPRAYTPIISTPESRPVISPIDQETYQRKEG
jgi:hypothetical protein